MMRHLQRALRGFGIEVRRPRPDLFDFIRDRRIELIYDVGANAGQFGAWTRERGYHGKLISFEPIRLVFQELEQKTRRDGKWKAFNFGLGDTAGQLDIHVSKDSRFSSFLDLDDAAVQFDQNSTAVSQERVEVKTLDDVADDDEPNYLIKIDTQGFEKAVLEGGRRTLSRSRGVLLELPIVETGRSLRPSHTWLHWASFPRRLHRLISITRMGCRWSRSTACFGLSDTACGRQIR